MRSRPSVVWNAVDLYILNMNLTNRNLFSISNAIAHFVCSHMRLCATPCKWFNALAFQNGFMMQNEIKHSQLCLKGLNGPN